MRERTALVFGVCLCVWLSGVRTYPQSVRSLVNSGNDLYAERNYTEAEVNYRKALEKDITSVPGHFNLGSALYKQGKFDDAVKAFEDAVRKSETPTTKAKAYYNLGDAYLKAEKYDEAIKAFTESLKLNPHDSDARYNLSYALLKKREQQNQNSDNKQQDKNQQDKNRQDQQHQQDQNQDKNEQQQQHDQQRQQQQEQPPNQQPRPQPQERMMSKAEAERILDVLKNSEKDVQRKLRQRVAGRARTERDW